MTSYNVYQPSLGGSLGSGIAKGLAEQLPVEIGRQRLASGLKQFEKESGNLTPMQQYIKLLSIPGLKESPQALQTFGELARSQAMANAYGQQGIQPIPLEELNKSDVGESNVPSVTKRAPLEATLNPYIRPTEKELRREASINFHQDPQRYAGKFENALDEARQQVESLVSQNEALKAARGSQENVEERIRSSLNRVAQKYDALKLPGHVLNTLESDAIKAVLPKNEGGEGLTEEQASKIYGKKLDDVGRQYQSIQDLRLIYPGEFKQRVAELQKKFEGRGDTKNLADELISKSDLSPMFAYSLAQPLNRDRELNSEVKSIKAVDPMAGLPSQKYLDSVYPKILDKLGTKGSPLAVAYELRRKGYDPASWFAYLSENRGKLTVDQLEQLDKPLNIGLPDIWLQITGK